MKMVILFYKIDICDNYVVAYINFGRIFDFTYRAGWAIFCFPSSNMLSATSL